MHRTTIPSWSALLREGALSRRRLLRAAAGTVGGIVGAGLLLPLAARADGDEGEDDERRIRTTSGFLTFKMGTGVPPAKPGTTTLTRSEEGLSVRVHVPGLTPGVYTFWMGVTDPDGSKYGGRLDGKIIGPDGIFNDRAEVEVGEIVGDFHIPGTGIQLGRLRNPLTSTVGMVVRSHGPASSDPATLYAQLHTHQTTVPSVTDYGISIHVPPP